MDSSPTCSKCGQEKHRTAPGKRWRCRPCDNAYTREWHEGRPGYNQQRCRDYAAAHREEASARARAYYAENKERVAEAARARYERDGEKIRARNRDAFRANPEPSRERARNSTWRLDNPEAARATVLRRRARKANAICEHGASCVDTAFLRGIYSATCTYCGAPAEHADHFVPLARNGLHCQENLVPACAPCNTSKSDRDPDEWIASRSRLGA